MPASARLCGIVLVESIDGCAVHVVSQQLHPVRCQPAAAPLVDGALELLVQNASIHCSTRISAARLHHHYSESCRMDHAGCRQLYLRFYKLNHSIDRCVCIRIAQSCACISGDFYECLSRLLVDNRVKSNTEQDSFHLRRQYTQCVDLMRHRVVFIAVGTPAVCGHSAA